MIRKPRIGVLGFSDGEPEVHEMLKHIVQSRWTHSPRLREHGQGRGRPRRSIGQLRIEHKEEATKLLGKGVDGTLFSYGVFSFPNFSAIVANNSKGPFMLVAPLNPDWPGMVAMLAAGGALHHLGIDHFRRRRRR